LGRSGLGVMALVASLLGVPISVAGGTVPDQVVMIVKTFELLGLLAVALPSRRHRLGVAATAFLAVVTSVAAFGSALSAGVSHHVGETPAAGMAMPVGVARQPTIEEAEAASDLAAATAAAIAEYEDVSVAASAGYDVADVWGVDHHADNPAYLDDGRILDPEHPETLVYGVDASGSPVLLGAMFQMPGVGVPGPMIGGPLTVWHAHEQVCVGVIPGLTVSLVSPFGMCPVGSFTVALTNEMIHVWTVTGAPDPFGDLDEDFRQEYLGLDGGGEP
ncbi:MAG: hypothetical protein OEX04_07430, partial [Acidimicrobiia bacterium]|nr:hypothetical protein [Acidimicrobiia bacterium]